MTPGFFPPPMGWVRDDEAVKHTVEEISSAQGFDAFVSMSYGFMQGSDDDAPFYAWKAEEKLFGRKKESWNQGRVGSCVSFGYGRGANDLLLFMAAQGLIDVPEADVATEPIYALSRVEVGGGRIRGDGSVGAWATKAVMMWGLLLRKVYWQYDLTRYSESLTRDWGNRGCPDELEPEAKKFPIKSAAICQTTEEAWRGLGSAYTLPICSNVGFNSPYQDGFCEPRGSWAHCMVIRGRTVAKKRGVNVRAYACQNSWGCFDDKTEVLTNNGWKLFKDVKVDDEVATLNQSDHSLEYHQPQAFHKYPYKGDMLNFRSRDVDLMVTPNHNMYIRPVHGKTEPRSWKTVRADECPKHFHIKKSVNIWSGEEVPYHETTDRQVPMDDWLEFLGYFLSEGYTTYYEYVPSKTSKLRYGQKQYLIGVCQKEGTQKHEKIASLMSRLPFRMFPVKNGWKCGYRKLHSELSEFGKADKKFVPDYAKKCSRRQLKILFDALMLGDGSISLGTTGYRRTYYTSSKRLADDVQEIALKIGYAADISMTDRREGLGNYKQVEYRVGIKIHEVEPRNGQGWSPDSVPYDGHVYCLTVPNHIMYVRRNGKASWCGNSYIQGDPHFTDADGNVEELPEGCFLIEERVLQSILSQKDSFLLSDAQGFAKRDPLSWFV